MVKAKKSLGQNFLIDKNIIQKIVKITNIKDKEVFEVGPGTGNLTTEILNANPKKLYLIEKDNDLSAILREKFKDKISLFNEDILKFDPQSLSNNKLTILNSEQKKQKNPLLLSTALDYIYFIYSSPTKASITASLTPMLLKPPSLYRFCKVTRFVKSLNKLTV